MRRSGVVEPAGSVLSPRKFAGVKSIGPCPHSKVHLKTDYEADSSLSNWGIKYNDERITVSVTIKKLANLHSEQFADDLQGFRIQNANKK